MIPSRRWAVVAVLASALALAPVLAGAWPVRDHDVSAADLRARVDGARDLGWSGYVETRGTLQLPSVDRFDSVGALFGEELRLRAWWRSGDAWRVDRLFTTGESDLARQDDLLWAWSFEHDRVNVSRDPEVRLPRTADLLPPEVGARVLRGVPDDAVSRIRDRRVAGRDALGLRVRPSGRSTIVRADLWADADTGVPLQVDLYAEGDPVPAFHTAFRDFDADRPAPGTVRIDPPPGVDRSVDDVLDIADAADQYAPVVPPPAVAGLSRSDASDGAVGIYGVGLTQLIVVPLRDREAVPLREQLARTVGNREVDTGTVVSLGPLGVLLTGGAGDGGWLVAGTVTEPTLESAARDVLRGARFVAEGS